EVELVEAERELGESVARFGAAGEASIHPLAGKRAGLRVERQRHVLRNDAERKAECDDQRYPRHQPLESPDRRFEHRATPPFVRPRIAERSTAFATKLTKG